MIDRKNNKNLIFYELVLIVGLIAFTISISQGILSIFIIVMLCIIVTVGRLVKVYNMTIGTYLVVLTLVLNAEGLHKQNILREEQLKQFKVEHKKNIYMAPGSSKNNSNNSYVENKTIKNREHY